MYRQFVTPTSSAPRPGISQPRRAPVNATPLTQRDRTPYSLQAVRSESTLPMLSSRPRPVQAPTKQSDVVPTAAISPPSQPRAKITEMIFCSSIQDRPEWAAVVPLLQTARTEPRWVKARLSSHDLAVRIVTLDGDRTIASANNMTGDVVRFLLISPTDVGNQTTTKKLQRLAQKKGGHCGVILFLLSNGDGGCHNMASYNQIQLDLRDTDMPILPLTAVATLPATVAAFCSQFTMPLRSDNCTSSGTTAVNLLRMHLGGMMPLSLDAVKRLVAAAEESGHHGLNGNTTLQDIVRFCSGLKDQNSRRLVDLLGAEDAARLADF